MTPVAAPCSKIASCPTYSIRMSLQRSHDLVSADTMASVFMMPLWLGLQPSVLGSVDVKGLHKNASCEISGWNSEFVNRPHQPVMSIAVPFSPGRPVAGR